MNEMIFGTAEHTAIHTMRGAPPGNILISSTRSVKRRLRGRGGVWQTRARRSRTRGVRGKNTGEVRHGLDESTDCVLISYFYLGDDRREEGGQGTRLRRGLRGGAIRVQSEEGHFVHVLEIIAVVRENVGELDRQTTNNRVLE